MDKVIRLMRVCTEGNTMAKVWRQIQESHCEEHLCRKDLYTTLLSQLNKAGWIVRKYDLPLTARVLRNTEGTILRVPFYIGFSPSGNVQSSFSSAKAGRELPTPRLLRKAFFITEKNSTEGERTQIMSTFAKILKYESHKKVTLTQAYWEHISLNKYSLNST